MINKSFIYTAPNHKLNNNGTSRLPNGDSSQDMKPFTYENGGENFVLSGKQNFSFFHFELHLIKSAIYDHNAIIEMIDGN